MESDHFEQQFEALLRRYIGFIVRDIHGEIQRARDKQYKKAGLKDWVEDILNNFQENEVLGELFEAFVIAYKEGDNIGQTLIDINKEYAKRKAETRDSADDPQEQVINKGRHRSKIGVWLRLFLKYLAFSEVYEKYDDIVSEPIIMITESKASNHNQVLNWTNIVSTKENKNDFVQLIYALHGAGFINHGKGEITKIVEEAASLFNVKLGNNWQSNHSASIHKAKRDYEPPIFSRIQEAYNKYANRQIEEKRKRR